MNRPEKNVAKDGDSGGGTSAPLHSRDATENLALLIAYDGSHFQGWQIQPQSASVQKELENALLLITRQKIKVYGSGRTDAGAHAHNQVANVHVPKGQDLYKLRKSINAIAGPWISVKAIVPVASDFHARHKATGKWYRYRIFNHPFPPAFGRDRVWWVRHPLDLAAMREAARHLLGTHDFSAFRSSKCAAASPRRTIARADISLGDEPEPVIRIDLEGSGFLQHMARIIVGTLLGVGLGKVPPHKMKDIVESRDREQALSTAPAGGLHLMRVEYDLEAYPELSEFYPGA
jgi:tRNA pseudouridine38-40 synthase